MLGRKNEMTREQKAVRALFTELMRSSLQTFPAFQGELNAPDRQGVYVIYDPEGKSLTSAEPLRPKVA